MHWRYQYVHQFPLVTWSVWQCRMPYRTRLISYFSFKYSYIWKKFAYRDHPHTGLYRLWFTIFVFCFYFLLFLVLLLCLAKYLFISCRNGQSLNFINKLSQTPVGRGGGMLLFGLKFSGYVLLSRVVFRVLSLKQDIQFYYSELLNTSSLWITSL